jgi:hypothetical protein
VPTDTITNFRASKHSTAGPARSGVGDPISDPNDPTSSGVNVIVLGGGPSAAFPHLIVRVERFSTFPLALGLASPADNLPREVTSNFDRSDPCISGGPRASADPVAVIVVAAAVARWRCQRVSA